jgi:hypothetical protein
MLSGLALLILAATAAADPSPPPHGDLAARSSSGATAMEYWDVTAWLESGHRFFSRFLVTNQGPGVATAAAVGHLVLPSDEIVPFKWGRRRDAWSLGPGGLTLEIAKASLALGGPMPVVTVASEKRGIDLRLEIARTGPLVLTKPLPDGYSIDVVMPAPARARVRVRGMDTAREVIGTAALTHTWMERPEGDLLRQRVECLAREGEVAMYLSDLTLADGSRRSTMVTSRAGAVLREANDVAVAFGSAMLAGGDPRYPLATRWRVQGAGLEARVDVHRELVRMNPLDIVPQPFRMLLALGGRPQRVWADATLDVAVTPRAGEAAISAAGRGVVAATFARPLDPP